MSATAAPDLTVREQLKRRNPFAIGALQHEDGKPFA
jgi:hypothetical protein